MLILQINGRGGEEAGRGEKALWKNVLGIGGEGRRKREEGDFGTDRLPVLLTRARKKGGGSGLF